MQEIIQQRSTTRAESRAWSRSITTCAAIVKGAQNVASSRDTEQATIYLSSYGIDGGICIFGGTTTFQSAATVCENLLAQCPCTSAAPVSP